MSETGKILRVLEAGENIGALAFKLEASLGEPGLDASTLRVACAPGSKKAIRENLGAKFDRVEILECQKLRNLLRPGDPAYLAFLPATAPYGSIPLENFRGEPDLVPWVPPARISEIGVSPLALPAQGWILKSKMLNTELGLEPSLSLRDFERLSRAKKIPIRYGSSPAALPALPVPSVPSSKIRMDSRVLALVPHFHCEEWLEQCLDSLVNQTRPPDGILVLDDGSPAPPLETVRKFPGIALWRSKKNVGPYGLIQAAIDQTAYDAYLFQDADDWSSLDRLELLLEKASQTGAELLGTQEMMILEDNLLLNLYPLDVNRAASAHPGYFLLHPSSLVSRDLVTRLGGYATGLRFSGDMEFSLRAALAAKVVNLDRYCYFRRLRKDSLITSRETGLASPARQELDRRIKERARENTALAAQGLPLGLSPLEKGEPAVFERLWGPALEPGPI